MPILLKPQIDIFLAANCCNCLNYIFLSMIALEVAVLIGVVTTVMLLVLVMKSGWFVVKAGSNCVADSDNGVVVT